MEMRRKIYDKLLAWKTTSEGKTALLIDGARRVGKSYIAETFGKNEYRSYVLIDFSEITDEVKTIFEKDSMDLDLFFNELSAVYGTRLHRRESLIIFDEVQLYPKARQMIKRLVKDGRFDYIETGSLISIRTNISEILIPSEEEHLEMNPMDFEEFLWALGNDTLYPVIKKHFEESSEVSAAVHTQAMNLFRQYMLVGGMPQSVLVYAETKDFSLADREKRRIISLYREDIARFAEGYENKVREVFDSIPSQLCKREKKFRVTALDKNARSRRYGDAVLWLMDGMIVNECYNTTDPDVALSMRKDGSSVKLYMADTGLLITMAFSEREWVENPLYRAILSGRLGINEGQIAENIVAQCLRANGHRLFFYSRNGDEGSMEIDFLIRRNLKTCPVEVKSSSRSRKHASLDRFMKKFERRIGPSFVLHTGNLEMDGNILYLPLYMACLL